MNVAMPNQDTSATALQPLGTPGRIIQDLCCMDLSKSTRRTVDAAYSQLDWYKDNVGGSIALGSYMGAEYFLSLGPSLSGSFNHIDYRQEHCIPEIVKWVKCTTSRSQTYCTSLAIAIGRLGVRFNPQQPILYSRWVMFMDQDHNAMVMFANSVDECETLPQPFTNEFVPIFGAKANLGELVIGFGFLANCFPYTEGQQIQLLYISSQTSWIAHFADFALDGHLYPAREFHFTISPQTIDHLRTSVNISYLTIPKYRGQIKLSNTRMGKLDIIAVRDFIGFLTFMKDLESANDKVVIGRKAAEAAEAAWCAAVLKTFVFQNEHSREMAHTYKFDKSVEAVSDCLLQTIVSRNFNSAAYWESKRLKHPGLDVTVSQIITRSLFSLKQVIVLIMDT